MTSDVLMESAYQRWVSGGCLHATLKDVFETGFRHGFAAGEESSCSCQRLDRLEKRVAQVEHDLGKIPKPDPLLAPITDDCIPPGAHARLSWEKDKDPPGGPPKPYSEWEKSTPGGP